MGLDLVLVSPRHLFRMPYSLHEKTSLASVVLDKHELEEFQPSHAHPIKVKVKQFNPSVEFCEAKSLVMQALDWWKTQEEKENFVYSAASKKENSFQPPERGNWTDKDFPEAIKKILHGMSDGKKRALFVLINFFRSLGMQRDELEKRVIEWNAKNEPPLKEGYIKAQIIWVFKHNPILPPNFSNPLYLDLGVFHEQDSRYAKNPVQYVIKHAKNYKDKNEKLAKPKKANKITRPKIKKDS
jgi:hypothetical protein